MYDHCTHDQVSLLNATNAASQDTSVEDWEGWVRHSEVFSMCNIEDIRGNIEDENLWLNPEDQLD